jgi:hypothetical protein
MTKLKSFNIFETNKRKGKPCYIFKLEVYLPIDKELDNILLEKCYNYNIQKNIFDEVVGTFKFHVYKEPELIETINNILTNKTFAMLYLNDSNWFLDLVSKLRIRYLDFSKIEFE